MYWGNYNRKNRYIYRELPVTSDTGMSSALKSENLNSEDNRKKNTLFSIIFQWLLTIGLGFKARISEIKNKKCSSHTQLPGDLLLHPSQSLTRSLPPSTSFYLSHKQQAMSSNMYNIKYGDEIWIRDGREKNVSVNILGERYTYVTKKTLIY